MKFIITHDDESDAIGPFDAKNDAYNYLIAIDEVDGYSSYLASAWHIVELLAPRVVACPECGLHPAIGHAVYCRNS